MSRPEVLTRPESCSGVPVQSARAHCERVCRAGRSQGWLAGPGAIDPTDRPPMRTGAVGANVTLEDRWGWDLHWTMNQW